MDKFIFNWNEFYSRNNAKIIENFLDREFVRFGEILDAFFPRPIQNGGKISKKKAYEVINNDFSKWRSKLFYQWPEYFLYIFCVDEIKDILVISPSFIEHMYNRKILDPFAEILCKKDYYYLEMKAEIEVNFDAVISIFISKNLLPASILRLARYSSNQCGFELNDAYYPEYDSHSNIAIIESEKNQSYEIPDLLTIDEVKEMKSVFKNYNAIFIALEKNLIGAYVKINPDCVRVDCLQLSNRPSEFRQANCGNANYLRRYNRLERLTKKHIEQLWIDGYVELQLPPYDFLNFVQTTDIETKFGIKRTIKSFNGNVVIKISDLVFIAEEINEYKESLKAPAQKKRQKFPEGYMAPWAVESRRLADEMALAMSKSGMQEITARNISDKVAKRLGENSDYWGTRGPRSGGNIRNIALFGWHFMPSQS